ncbi:restriction endonuclease [Bacillus manliponensis]|uniref:site-specific DNA-methyltransferase (adenine-specific) n=1 Tax=Bacillus manliponensis TaxID=574376 RepID=A0A073JY74_9BACI|nr:BREX-1 system adenine-specific DNA-methyltransferase PglX [Bacillus manliponensis]KEK19924.1 restriction endonuclease [Bacillus manliponensis]
MDKSAIKNFATTARTKLIENVKQKAYGLGITEKEIVEPEMYQGGFRIGERTFKEYQKKHYNKLVVKIREKGYKQVVEEVAYTWFNRLIAIRFMEVNEYLPIGVRVLSSAQEGKVEPDVVSQVTTYVEDLELDINLVYELQDANNTEELFKYILVKQCNKLNEILPDMFEQIEDYTELLLPDNLLQEGSVLRDLVTMVPEDDWKEQVEIIGWLYQEYISEKKAVVDKIVKKGGKVSKENIPAKTQIFTPDWIVKYMVENSLGKMWVDSYADTEIKQTWKYFLNEAEQDESVKEKLKAANSLELSPEEIKFLDPCMGSGHILVYAFDVLFQMYKEAGYIERDIPRYIIEKNLYGIDIDERAVQLAYFSILMKARSYNRRIFRHKLRPNLVAIKGSNTISNEAMNYLINGGTTETVQEIKSDEVEYLLQTFNDAEEYGSILEIKEIDFQTIENRLEELKYNENIDDMFSLNYRDSILEYMPSLIKQAKLLCGKYDIIITNPPYMSSSDMNLKLAKYVQEHYPNSKKDMSTVFMERAQSLSKKNGYFGMINIPTWMNLSSYEKLRLGLLKSSCIVSLLHLGRGVFGSDFGSVSFVFRNEQCEDYVSHFVKMFEKKSSVENNEEKQKRLFNSNNHYFQKQSNFFLIEGAPIAYDADQSILDIYEREKKIGDIASPKQGLATGSNDTFVRLWFEVCKGKIGFHRTSRTDAESSKLRWFPYNKGGEFRKYYGNNYHVVNWENDGEEIRNFKNDKGKLRSRPQNMNYYFKECITWSKVTIGGFSTRYVPNGFIFDVAGCSIFCKEEEILYLLGLTNSKVAEKILSFLSPTVNYEVGHISNIPIVYSEIEAISEMVKVNLELAREDWDFDELSWDFKEHPFITFKSQDLKLQSTFCRWDEILKMRFEKFRLTQEKLNKVFLELYGVNSTSEYNVNDSEVTLRKANFDVDIHSFISYSVGCMFGRYSLDVKGLVNSGEIILEDKYSTFKYDEDNIIPITDDDYFEDDIVSRFIEFLIISFGKESLEENLDFISEGIGRKSTETSRQAIRRYFISEFFGKHVQKYTINTQKRPIYWLFDSGKQDGFKALIYMHRYDESTIAQVRTDYLHTLQRKYEAEMNRQDMIIDGDGSSREKTEAKKKKEKLQKQLLECIEYDQVIAHVANQRIGIDLDDGVKVNYMKFQNIEVPQGEGKKPLKANLLANIKL